MPWSPVNLHRRDLADFTGQSNGALGSRFALRNGSTNPQVISQAMDSNAAGFFPADFIEFTCAGPDQYAAVTLAAVGTSASQMLYLRSQGTSTTGVMMAWLSITGGSGNGVMSIYTAQSWGFASSTQRTTVSTLTYATGDFIEFYVVNNTYYGRQNGTLVTSWNDSGAAVNSTGRTVGFAIQNASVMTFKRVIAGDMRPTPLYLPNQSITRSTMY
ncbi:hypothetical protein [Nocardia sp. NPDC004260]